MAEKVVRAGIERKKGWLYYLDRNLNVYRAKMVRGGEKKKSGDRPELVLKTDMKRDQNYLYYVDKAGDIARHRAGNGSRAREAGTCGRSQSGSCARHCERRHVPLRRNSEV